MSYDTLIAKSPSIIFQPGGVAGGLVVTTWAEVQKFITFREGAVFVYIDDSLAPAVVDVGITDCEGRVTFLAATTKTTPTTTVLTVPEGAILRDPYKFTATLNVVATAGVTPIISITGDRIVILDEDASIDNQGVAPIARAGLGQSITFIIAESSAFRATLGALLDLSTATSSGAILTLDTASLIGNNVFTGVVGATAALMYDASLGGGIPTNPGFAGTFTATAVDKAQFVAYTPAVPADWPVPPTQVAQALDELAASRLNVSAGTTSNWLASITFSDSNNISFGLNASTLTALAQIKLSAGTTSNLGSAFTFADSNNVSFGLNGSTITASVSLASSQGSINFSAGTTSNNLSAITFSNSNNVSFGLDGSTMTASANSLAAAAGTQTATSGTVVFSNSNGISFGMSNSSVITASYTQSTAPAAISAGTTLASSGTVVFSNSNNVSFGMNGNTVTASAAVSAMASINFSAGTTSQNLSAITFSDSNNVSFGLNGSTMTASANSLAAAAGTQTATSGTVVFSNSNNVTFGMSNSSVVTASVTVASTQASINLSAGTTSNLASAFTFADAHGVSFGLDASTITASIATSLTNINVSAGTTSNNLSAVTFSNSNNVSFGLNASTITASANSLAAAAGTQTATSGTVVFSNSNNVTFGMSNSSVVTASVTVASTQASINLSAGTTSNLASAFTFSNSNNVSFGLNASTITAAAQINVSAGTTSNNLSAVTFSNSNGVSFGLNASTITASFGQSVSMFSQAADFATNFTASIATMSLQKISFPMNLSATQMVMLAAFIAAAGRSGAVTLSHAVYTFNGATASLASSASRAISWTTGAATTASSIYGGVSGTRYRTVGVNYSLTPGDYLFGWWISTANTVTVNVFGKAGPTIVGSFDGVETSLFVDGTSASSFSTAFPSSIAGTDTNYVRTGIPALRQPGAIFVGTGL